MTSPPQDEAPKLPSSKQPFACPVCHGKGKVPAGFYWAIGVDSWTVSDTTPEPCRSCNGIGMVWG